MPGNVQHRREIRKKHNAAGNGGLPVSPIPRRIPVFEMRFQIRIPIAANSSQTSSLMRKPGKVRRTGCDFWQCSGSSWRDKLQKARKVHCLSPQESRAPLAGGAFLHVWASLDFSCLFCRSVRALELPCTDNMSIPPLTFRWRGKFSIMPFRFAPPSFSGTSAAPPGSARLPAAWRGARSCRQYGC